jgi:hypothetical protein
MRVIEKPFHYSPRLVTHNHDFTLKDASLQEILSGERARQLAKKKGKQPGVKSLESWATEVGFYGSTEPTFYNVNFKCPFCNSPQGLSTHGQGLGVYLASCLKCNQPLHLILSLCNKHSTIIEKNFLKCLLSLRYAPKKERKPVVIGQVKRGGCLRCELESQARGMKKRGYGTKGVFPKTKSNKVVPTLDYMRRYGRR